MKTAYWILLLAGCSLFWNCSDDNIGERDLEIAIEIPDFQLLGEDENSVYRYSYDSESDEGTATNITQEDNIDRFYISLRQVSDVLAFFSLADGNFSLTLKDLNASGTVSIENFISISSERSIIWGATTESQIIMANYSPPNSGALFIRTQEIEDGSFVDTPLATNVFTTSQPLYFQQRLFVTYLDNNDQYNLLVVDTETLDIIRTFEFGDQSPGILIDSNGELVLLLSDGNLFTREIYAVNTMELIEMSSFSLNQFLGTGPLDAYLVDERLYYLFSLVQPSPVASAPAFFDFSSGENGITDILEIREMVRDQIGSETTPTAFGFDVQSRTFFMGYAKNNSSSGFDGGVMVISENGELIEVIELPFVPTYFIRS